jgi:hypothetical protein
MIDFEGYINVILKFTHRSNDKLMYVWWLFVSVKCVVHAAFAQVKYRCVCRA